MNEQTNKISIKPITEQTKCIILCVQCNHCFVIHFSTTILRRTYLLSCGLSLFSFLTH